MLLFAGGLYLISPDVSMSRLVSLPSICDSHSYFFICEPGLCSFTFMLICLPFITIQNYDLFIIYNKWMSEWRFSLSVLSKPSPPSRLFIALVFCGSPSLSYTLFISASVGLCLQLTLRLQNTSQSEHTHITRVQTFINGWHSYDVACVFNLFLKALLCWLVRCFVVKHMR